MGQDVNTLETPNAPVDSELIRFNDNLRSRNSNSNSVKTLNSNNFATTRLGAQDLCLKILCHLRRRKQVLSCAIKSALPAVFETDNVATEQLRVWWRVAKLQKQKVRIASRTNSSFSKRHNSSDFENAGRECSRFFCNAETKIGFGSLCEFGGRSDCQTDWLSNWCCCEYFCLYLFCLCLFCFVSFFFGSFFLFCFAFCLTELCEQQTKKMQKNKKHNTTPNDRNKRKTNNNNSRNKNLFLNEYNSRSPSTHKLFVPSFRFFAKDCSFCLFFFFGVWVECQK